LVENKLGIYNPFPIPFDSIGIEYKWPYRITNAIIELDLFDLEEKSNILRQLIDLDCQSFELWFAANVPYSSMYDIIRIFDDSGVKSIDLVLSQTAACQTVEKLKSYPRVHSIYVTNQDGTSISNTPARPTDRIGSSVGLQSRYQWIVSAEVYVESLHANVGLNGTISINRRGEVKIRPNHNRVFGNIYHSSIPQILENSGLTDFWKITKDMIPGCNQCAHRNMCYDEDEIVEVHSQYTKSTPCDQYKKYLSISV
jgi:MoaA/NifB/PqqE/SkfB family radical SAM enzyme